jgi:hypothetical protein
VETGLQLLMRDGASKVAFHPRLTAEQYAELMRIVDQCSTKADLRAALERAAKVWGNEVEIDG